MSLQALRRWVVLFLCHVIGGFVKQLERFVQPTSPRQVFIHGHVIVDIFSIVNRSGFDFVDRSINIGDGILFLLL
jgi:hypothetical protein